MDRLVLTLLHSSVLQLLLTTHLALTTARLLQKIHQTPMPMRNSSFAYQPSITITQRTTTAPWSRPTTASNTAQRQRPTTISLISIARPQPLLPQPPRPQYRRLPLILRTTSTPYSHNMNQSIAKPPTIPIASQATTVPHHTCSLNTANQLERLIMMETSYARRHTRQLNIAVRPNHIITRFHSTVHLRLLLLLPLITMHSIATQQKPITIQCPSFVLVPVVPLLLLRYMLIQQKVLRGNTASFMARNLQIPIKYTIARTKTMFRCWILTCGICLRRSIVILRTLSITDITTAHLRYSLSVL